MDQFLLNNVTRYRSLVEKFSPPAAPQVKTDINSPDMVVSARIRPLLQEETESGFPSAVFPRSAKGGVVDVHTLYHSPRGPPVLKSFSYEVDRLFDSDITTEEIYSSLIVDLIPLAWNGNIGTLFAYGQTGSGKTFTISRLQQLATEALLDGSQDGQRDIYITIIDLAGNSAFDLLNSRKPISVLEDSFGVTQLAGADEQRVRDRDEMMAFIDRAASFRRTASTVKNDASSRSHGICRIRINDPATGSNGLMYLIDLAGSEAARDIAEHGADRMRETREINMSLSVLKDCIRGKVEGDMIRAAGGPKSKTPYVPFRQSALTKVLKHVFDPAGGQKCKTVIIACVNPSLADVGPSKNTLRYAEMLRMLVPADGKVALDPKAPMAWTNAQLKDWIAKNSGTPPVSAAILAPKESGALLLRLPAEEFESRCLKTPGVTVEQAAAFRSKLWQVHIDSQRSGQKVQETSRLSSRVSDSTSAALPFQQRVRPGMVVSWNSFASDGTAVEGAVGSKMAVVLSPVGAAPESTPDALNDVVDSSLLKTAFLCAQVVQGAMADSYEVHLWSQVVVDVAMMSKEVILEYDTATRYYHIAV